MKPMSYQSFPHIWLWVLMMFYISQNLKTAINWLEKSMISFRQGLPYFKGRIFRFRSFVKGSLSREIPSG